MPFICCRGKFSIHVKYKTLNPSLSFDIIQEVKVHRSNPSILSALVMLFYVHKKQPLCFLHAWRLSCYYIFSNFGKCQAPNLYNLGSNLYPTPHTVCNTSYFLALSFSRIFFICTSTVRMSPIKSYPHT